MMSDTNQRMSSKDMTNSNDVEGSKNPWGEKLRDVQIDWSEANRSKDTEDWIWHKINDLTNYN